MKKQKIIVTLNFVPDVNVDFVRKIILDDNCFKSNGAETVRIIQQYNKLIIEFYDIKNEKKILKQKDLLLHINRLINDTYLCTKRYVDLISITQHAQKDYEETRKQLNETLKNYNKFVNHE